MQKSVLLVEDELIIALDLKQRLGNLGFQVIGTAMSAENAIEAAQRLKPDLVLMDIVLEDSMDGIEAAERILELLDVPVVYLTSCTDAETIARAQATSPLGYLIKPVEDREIQITLELALYKHRAERELKRSEARYRLLFQEMLNAFALHEIILDDSGRAADYRFLEVNPAFERITGLRREEVVGRTARDIIPAIEPFWIEMFGRVALDRRSVRFENYLRSLDLYLDVAAYSPKPGQVAAVFEDVTALRKKDARPQPPAVHDPLTELPDRTLCLDRICQAIERSRRRSNYLYAVLILDLDKFRLVNDSLGHLTGDKLLREVASLLRSHLRGLDTLARIGGDEFAILLEEIRSPAEAIEVARRILKALQEPIVIEGRTLYASASVGGVLGPAEYERPEELLQNATVAVNHAKSLGGGRFKVFKWSMRQTAARTLDIETRLRSAVRNDEFEVHYQPILCLADRRTVGFEALVRWRRSSGLVPPDEFIPIAEATGLIIPIGNRVLAEVCSALTEWRTRPDLAGLYVAVNLSARQFSQPDLVKQLARTIREAGIDPGLLKVEITESVVMSNPHSAVMKLRGLRELGVSVAIDDFGTGYSSLSYLQRFPVDTLKVDRSFIADMTKHENYLIVKTVVSLAHNLGLEIVAEGIETEDQLRRLAQLNCHYGQGYLFSRPVPRDLLGTASIDAA